MSWGVRNVMEDVPATALVPVAAGNEAAPSASAAPGVVSSVPVDDTAQKKALEKHFTTLRHVVEVEEMELDTLCASSGLGACLKTMADREHNPILQDGECPCVIDSPPATTLLLQLVPLI